MLLAQGSGRQTRADDKRQTMNEQLQISDEQAMTAPTRWLLERMIEPVLRLNFLADQNERQQWDATGMWAPSLGDGATRYQVELFGLMRGRLDELVAVYERATLTAPGRCRDWTRDFEALTGWRVQHRGRFITQPLRWMWDGIGNPAPVFSSTGD
jgi:hypothetical protein